MCVCVCVCVCECVRMCIQIIRAPSSEALLDEGRSILNEYKERRASFSKERRRSSFGKMLTGNPFLSRNKDGQPQGDDAQTPRIDPSLDDIADEEQRNGAKTGGAYHSNHAGNSSPSALPLESGGSTLPPPNSSPDYWFCGMSASDEPLAEVSAAVCAAHT